jgi:predicted RecB family nuclease
MAKATAAASVTRLDIPRARTLRELSGVGPSIEKDLKRLGVTTVEGLAKRDGTDLYESLCTVTKTRQDPCVLDTFRCAVAQARNPDLPSEQRQWWWWSRKRKLASR